jgi:hypothetical protein
MVVIRGVIVRFIVVRIHLCSHPVEHSGPSTLKQDFRVIQKFLPFLVGYHPVRKVWKPPEYSSTTIVTNDDTSNHALCNGNMECVMNNYK